MFTQDKSKQTAPRKRVMELLSFKQKNEVKLTGKDAQDLLAERELSDDEVVNVTGGVTTSGCLTEPLCGGMIHRV